jgi:hypothetical protein
MGRMTQPLLTVNRRDKRRPVQGGGGGGTPSTGEKLLYNPALRVPLTSPITLTVPASTAGNTSVYTVRLGQSSASSGSTFQNVTQKHAKIIMPNIRHGRLDIFATPETDCRVWIIGGQIKRYSPAATRLLTIQGVDHAYLEGMWLNGNHLAGSGIVNNGSGSLNTHSMWVQNCLITGINYLDTAQGDFDTAHGDFVISQLAMRGGMWFNKVTGWCWVTGFIMAGATSGNYPLGFHFTDCNFYLYNTQYNPKAVMYPGQSVGYQTGAAIFFQIGDNCVNWPMTFDECYLWDDQPGTVLAPDGTTSDSRKSLATLARFNNCRTVSGDTFTGTVDPTLSNTTGVIRGGIPPNGNFVNSGLLQYGSVNTGPTHSGCFDGSNYPQPTDSNHPGYLE